MSGRIARSHQNRMDTAIGQQSGMSQQDAEAAAMEDAQSRQPATRGSSGEEAKPPGMLDSLKGMFGIGRDEEEGDEDEAVLKNRRVESDIGSSIGSMMLNGPDSEKAYQTAMQGSNPPTMLGTMAARSLLSAREKMEEQGILSDEKIWTAEDGVLDNLIGEVFSNAKMYTGYEPADEDFDTAYTSALNMFKKMAEGGGQEGGGEPQGPPQGGPSALRGVA